MRFHINHVVAILAICLALSSFLALRRYGFPLKVCFGAGVLSVLVVAMFWTAIALTGGPDEDD